VTYARSYARQVAADLQTAVEDSLFRQYVIEVACGKSAGKRCAHKMSRPAPSASPSHRSCVGRDKENISRFAQDAYKKTENLALGFYFEEEH